MNIIHPKSIQKGDTIGLITPSSPLEPGSLDAGMRYLEEKGFKIKLGKHINDSMRFLAGNDSDRAKDFMDFIKDPEVKAIIATRGGQGSQRMLPLLDYDVIRSHPKILVGFSDTTALQLGLLAKADLTSYSGFTLTVELNALIDRTLMSCLQGESYQIVEGTPAYPGVVEAPLIGGNLSLLTSLIGTPYQPNFKGSILLLEDVEIEPFNVDRMISHLDLAGVFDQVVGIIFGEFEHCISRDPQCGTIEDVINEWSLRYKVPCLKNFPYGHGARSCVLPIGKRIKLDVNARSVNVI